MLNILNFLDIKDIESLMQLKEIKAKLVQNETNEVEIEKDKKIVKTIPIINELGIINEIPLNSESFIVICSNCYRCTKKITYPTASNFRNIVRLFGCLCGEKNRIIIKPENFIKIAKGFDIQLTEYNLSYYKKILQFF